MTQTELNKLNFVAMDILFINSKHPHHSIRRQSGALVSQIDKHVSSSPELRWVVCGCNKWLVGEFGSNSSCLVSSCLCGRRWCVSPNNLGQYELISGQHGVGSFRRGYRLGYSDYSINGSFVSDHSDQGAGFTDIVVVNNNTKDEWKYRFIPYHLWVELKESGDPFNFWWNDIQPRVRKNI